MNKLIRKGAKAKTIPDTEFSEIIIQMYKKRISKGKDGIGGNGLFYIGYHMDKARIEYTPKKGNVLYIEKNIN